MRNLNNSISGFALGFGIGLFTTKDLEESLNLGGEAALKGLALGFGQGMVEGYQFAKKWKINPWKREKNYVTSESLGLNGTLNRIDENQLGPHRNDGSVFKNNRSDLPAMPPNYYREYVHEIPGSSYPGRERIVIGENGEYYYSPDHFHTFIRFIPTPW